MGCYDEVAVPCPQCGEFSILQSKGGDCLMRVFTLENAPNDVLSDINRHAPDKCFKCDTSFWVNPTTRKVIIGDVIDHTQIKETNLEVQEEMRSAARNALAIVDPGACNAIAISGTLNAALLAGMHQGVGNQRDTLATDPAYAPARLIMHQLTFLMSGTELYNSEQYTNDCAECERLTKG